MLREERIRIGLKQRDIARHLGIDIRNYQRLESGANIGSEKLKKMYELGMDICMIVLGEPAKPAESPLHKGWLRASINQVEKNFPNMKYDKKAELIYAIYDFFADSDVKLDAKGDIPEKTERKIANFLKLV